MRLGEVDRRMIRRLLKLLIVGELAEEKAVHALLLRGELLLLAEAVCLPPLAEGSPDLLLPLGRGVFKLTGKLQHAVEGQCIGGFHLRGWRGS